jgi:serine/threonine-protein kinase
MSRLRQLIHEMHRRSLWQVLGIYVVGSWLVLQVVDTLAGALNLPDWAPPFALFLLIIGFPIVLATAFIQEGTRPADPEVKPASEPLPQEGTGHLLTWRNAVLGAIGAALLWGGVAIGWFLFGRNPEPGVDVAVAAEAHPGIAVLPFSVTGSEVDALGEGVVHLLHSNLNEVGGLRAIAPGTVLAQWDRRVAAGERADLETALEVAAASGGNYALVGSAVSLGPRVRLEGTLYEVRDAASLGQVRVEGDPGSVWMLVDELAIEVVRALGQVGVGEFSGFDLAAATTSSISALQAYLRGETSYRRGEFDVAIPAFELAAAEDTTFALAEYRLGLAQGWSTFDPAVARRHLQAALAAGLPEREGLFARAMEGYLNGSVDALGEVRAYLQSHPDDAEAWYILGDALLHAGMGQVGDWYEEGQRALNRAVELDPGFAPFVIHPLQLALVSGDSARASNLVETFGAIRPGSPNDKVHRVIQSQEHGTSDSSSVAAAVDTLSALGAYPGLLVQSTRSEELLEAYLLRQAQTTGEIDMRLCLHVPLRHGRLQKLEDYATDPRMAPGLAFACPYIARMLGLPISDEMLEQAAARLPEEALDTPNLLAAAYAIDRGGWDEYDAVLGRMRQQLEDAEAEGDSAAIDGRRFQLRSAEAIGLMERGQLQEAADAFEALRSPFWTHRWWLGQIYLELGQPRDAIQWLNTFVSISGAYWPLAHLYLGQAYEELGDAEQARNAYAAFLDMWRDADPELQPLVEEARAALELLGPLDQ